MSNLPPPDASGDVVEEDDRPEQRGGIWELTALLMYSRGWTRQQPANS